MEKLANFLLYGNRNKVFLSIFLVFFVMFFILIKWFNINQDGYISILIESIILDSLLAFIIFYAIMITRKSISFWDDYEILKDKIENVNTISEVKALDDEFDALKKKGFGSPHYSAFNKLVAIRNTTLKYLNK